MARNFACPHCPKTFRTESGRTWHLGRTHREPGSQDHGNAPDINRAEDSTASGRQGQASPVHATAVAQTRPSSAEADNRIADLESQMGGLEDLNESLLDGTREASTARENAERRAQELEAARDEAVSRLQQANAEVAAKTEQVSELEEQLADAQRWFAARLAQAHPAGLCKSRYCRPCEDARANVTRTAKESYAQFVRTAAHEFGLDAECDKIGEAANRYLHGERLGSLTLRIVR